MLVKDFMTPNVLTISEDKSMLEARELMKSSAFRRIPVVDDNTMETVQLYIANILTVSEAVERLRYNKVNNQVSFHTEKALQYLQLTRRDSYARNDL